jgi:uncharacterized protein (TIGR02594 family)
MSPFTAAKPRIFGHGFRIALMASCVGLLALNGPVFSKPAAPDSRITNRAEANRPAQLRQARTVRHAARKPPRNTAAVQSAAVLVARPHVAEKPPLFGWPTLVTEARKYVGTNPTDRKRLWCATFLNLVLAKSGYAGTGSDAAKSFASYGKRINEPTVGAIAVLTRGKRGGHVGIVTGIDSNGNPIIISGNHGHRVGEATYPRQRVIAYVMPTGRATLTRLASAAPVPPIRASDTEHENGFSSPIEELLAAINAERGNGQRSKTVQAAARPALPPQARPAPYRLGQQMPTSRRQSADHRRSERAVVDSPPLPRQRLAVRLAPLPRTRPQVN